jgi:hypothetical protein
MELNILLIDKQIKPKEKTETLCKLILDKQITVDQLVDIARSSKDPVKATCIESIEYASLRNPSILTADAFEFITECLTDKAPRVKWESAKVIGN